MGTVLRGARPRKGRTSADTKDWEATRGAGTRAAVWTRLLDVAEADVTAFMRRTEPALTLLPPLVSPSAAPDAVPLDGTSAGARGEAGAGLPASAGSGVRGAAGAGEDAAAADVVTPAAAAVGDSGARVEERGRPPLMGDESRGCDVSVTDLLKDRVVRLLLLLTSRSRLSAMAVQEFFSRASGERLARVQEHLLPQRLQ